MKLDHLTPTYMFLMFFNPEDDVPRKIPYGVRNIGDVLSHNETLTQFCTRMKASNLFDGDDVKLSTKDPLVGQVFKARRKGELISVRCVCVMHCRAIGATTDYTETHAIMEILP